MRANIVKQKEFLKKVYKSRKASEKIQEADPQQLKALAFAVHLVINKRVPLTKRIAKFFNKLSKSRIGALKRFFGSKEQLLSFLKSDKKKQIRVIKRFVHLIKVLLTSFFAPDNNIVSESDKNKILV